MTSYNNRTSVVLRGKWILDNLLAAPPPPPPPDVPPLDAVPGGKQADPARADGDAPQESGLRLLPQQDGSAGLSLENFDAVGAWRTTTAGKPIDASGVLPDGTKFAGPAGLQGVLMARKDQFVEAFTERLMIYALGRGVEGQ